MSTTVALANSAIRRRHEGANRKGGCLSMIAYLRELAETAQANRSGTSRASGNDILSSMSKDVAPRPHWITIVVALLGIAVGVYLNERKNTAYQSSVVPGANAQPKDAKPPDSLGTAPNSEPPKVTAESPSRSNAGEPVSPQVSDTHANPEHSDSTESATSVRQTRDLSPREKPEGFVKTLHGRAALEDAAKNDLNGPVFVHCCLPGDPLCQGLKNAREDLAKEYQDLNVKIYVYEMTDADVAEFHATVLRSPQIPSHIFRTPFWLILKAQGDPMYLDQRDTRQAIESEIKIQLSMWNSRH
jgi:hypothetical protein